MLDWTLLRSFLAVVDSGSLSAAADRLGLDEAIETADGAESEDDIAPLTGSAAIAEEDVL